MQTCASFGQLALFLAIATVPASATQSPLTALVDWKDGRVADGVGPATAVAAPVDQRFWIGQGLRRAQIRISDRERRFEEELGPDQNYVTAIVDLALDESSSAALDHRLFVLTAAQSTKVSMPEPGQLQMLSVEFPNAPNEVAALEVDPNPMDEFHYSIQAIDLVEDEKLVVAGGFRINPNVQFSDQLVVQIYRYGPQVPNGPDTLVRIADDLLAPVPLLPCDGLTRWMRRVQGIDVQRVNGQLLGFARTTMSGMTHGAAQGIGVLRIDPDAVDPGDRVIWYEGPNHRYDPYYDVFCGHQLPCKNLIQAQTELQVTPKHVGVNDVTFVTLEGEPTQHLAYFACDSFNQILEFDITDFDASGLPEINSLLASPSSSPTTTPASRPC